MDEEMIRGRAGQVAIWIIIALALVIFIALIFLMRPKPEIEQAGETINPVPFIQTCARKAIYDALDIMLPQGGFIAPQNYKLYKNTKITYICENTGNFKPCVNQHPVLIEEVARELENYTAPEIDNCFYALQDELKKRNVAFEMGDMSLNVELAPQRVIVNVQRDMRINNADQSSDFGEFKVDVVHPVYDLINVANEIASQEAKYCYFEYVGYMILYPQFVIEKTALSDSTKIYTISDLASKRKFNIAIRGCAIPPGI